MTTTEIISNFLRGSNIASISEKQKTWLLGQAKRENVALGNCGYYDTIYFNDCMYTIKSCKRLASGGSYVGTKIIQGRYNIERLYTVRFTDTGNTFVYGQNDLDHVTREGYSFEIIPPHINK